MSTAQTKTTRSGHSETLLPDGARVVATADGDFLAFPACSDARVLLTKNQTDQTVWTADGSIVHLLPDGTAQVQLPTGLRYETRPDGTKIVFHPQGGRRTTHANGTMTETSADGDEFVVRPDGSATRTWIDGSVIPFP